MGEDQHRLPRRASRRAAVGGRGGDNSQSRHECRDTDRPSMNRPTECCKRMVSSSGSTSSSGLLHHCWTSVIVAIRRSKQDRMIRPPRVNEAGQMPSPQQQKTTTLGRDREMGQG